MNLQQLLTLRVQTPEGVIVEKTDVESIIIPLANACPIGIRPGHAPLIAETDLGMIKYRQNEKFEKINLHSGVMEIRNNVITILTAGEVDKFPEEFTQLALSDYDRLMQTLVEQIISDPQEEKE